MSQKRIYAIRSDVHGRVDLSRRHFEETKSSYAGLFDLGDIEAQYVGLEHPLRQEQLQNEQTMDAIIKNSRAFDGKKRANRTIQDTLSSVGTMSSHLRIAQEGVCYRGIAGNSAESWMKIFEAIANSKQQEELRHLFEEFDLIREPTYEFFGIESVILCLPWKASMTTLMKTLSDLERYDPAKIVVLSHDYFTKASLKPEWYDAIKPMQNEEQAVTTLDSLAQRDCKLVVCYGHIGFEYERAEVRFQHKGKEMIAYHTDEKNGKLLELEL